MTIVIVFIGVLVGIAAWWLANQRLMSKPWLEEGVIGPPVPHPGGAATATAKVGLGVFLAVVGSLFALLMSAYSIRMQAPDWASLPETRLLWVNTGVLVLGSMALQWAAVAARRGPGEDVSVALAAGGVSVLVFLAGQLLVWRELMAAGFFATTHPASAFFYLVTAIHGLHLVGGLIALGCVLARAWQPDRDPERVRLGVELCAWYWHFLLLIWLVLFSTMSLGAWWDWLYAVCFGS